MQARDRHQLKKNLGLCAAEDSGSPLVDLGWWLDDDFDGGPLIAVPLIAVYL